MQNKLFSSALNYAKSEPIRFHMPAHNGEDIQITTAMDITELSFSDNLIESNGVIKNCEQNIAKAYGTKYALMLTNGATMGVAIALHTAKNIGNKLLLIGDCHKSVHNYANAFNFNITYANDLDNINPNDFDAVLITTPDYFGKVKDICKLQNTSAVVIVDASHGSHFAFCKNLPQLDTKDADITILSFHKTLPVLTGGAGILCNDQTIFDLLYYSRSVLHSSSPSYLTMASIDNAIRNFSQNGETLYNNCIAQIENFKKQLCGKYQVVETHDKTRLCICAKGLDGKSIANKLEEQNIFLEMTYYDILVAIVTPYNCKHLSTLAQVLNNIDVQEKAIKINTKKLSKIDTKCKKVEFLQADKCVDRIAAGNIGIYPPGTPIITTGDILDSEIIDFLLTTKCEIFGLINGKIPVYKS